MFARPRGGEGILVEDRHIFPGTLRKGNQFLVELCNGLAQSLVFVLFHRCGCYVCLLVQRYKQFLYFQIIFQVSAKNFGIYCNFLVFTGYSYMEKGEPKPSPSLVADNPAVPPGDYPSHQRPSHTHAWMMKPPAMVATASHRSKTFVVK